MSKLLLQPISEHLNEWDAIVGAATSYEAVDGATPSDAEYVESGTEVGVFSLRLQLVLEDPTTVIMPGDAINFVTLKARSRGQSGSTATTWTPILRNETNGSYTQSGTKQEIDGNQWWDYAEVIPNPKGGSWNLTDLANTMIRARTNNDKGTQLSWFVLEVDYTPAAGGEAGPWTLAARIPAGNEAMTISGLQNGIEYEVQLFAVDASGNVSTGSTVAEETPSAGDGGAGGPRPHTLARRIEIPQLYRLRDRI